jgi:hypothetical protein
MAPRTLNTLNFSTPSLAMYPTLPRSQAWLSNGTPQADIRGEEIGFEAEAVLPQRWKRTSLDHGRHRQREDVRLRLGSNLERLHPSLRRKMLAVHPPFATVADARRTRRQVPERVHYRLPASVLGHLHLHGPRFARRRRPRWHPAAPGHHSTRLSPRSSSNPMTPHATSCRSHRPVCPIQSTPTFPNKWLRA